MQRPNPLSPSLMTPAERRADLCRLLALGLVRLRLRNADQPYDGAGEFPLHNPADPSGSADAKHRRNA